jgi:hypothetical protein
MRFIRGSDIRLIGYVVELRTDNLSITRHHRDTRADAPDQYCFFLRFIRGQGAYNPGYQQRDNQYRCCNSYSFHAFSLLDVQHFILNTIYCIEWNAMRISRGT